MNDLCVLIEAYPEGREMLLEMISVVNKRTYTITEMSTKQVGQIEYHVTGDTLTVESVIICHPYPIYEKAAGLILRAIKEHSNIERLYIEDPTHPRMWAAFGFGPTMVQDLNIVISKLLNHAVPDSGNTKTTIQRRN